METDGYEKLIAELRAQRARLKWSIDKLGHESGVKAATLYRRFADPETFTLAELIAIATALKIDYAFTLDNVEIISSRIDTSAGVR